MTKRCLGGWISTKATLNESGRLIVAQQRSQHVDQTIVWTPILDRESQISVHKRELTRDKKGKRQISLPETNQRVGHTYNSNKKIVTTHVQLT